MIMLSPKLWLNYQSNFVSCKHTRQQMIMCNIIRKYFGIRKKIGMKTMVVKVTLKVTFCGWLNKNVKWKEFLSSFLRYIHFSLLSLITIIMTPALLLLDLLQQQRWKCDPFAIFLSSFWRHFRVRSLKYIIWLWLCFAKNNKLWSTSRQFDRKTWASVKCR